MRKSIKESTIRKLIRREILNEAEGRKENNDSQFDQFFRKALNLTSNIKFSDNHVSFLQSVLHLFIVATSENKSSDASKLKEQSSNLASLSKKVVENCPCDNQRLKLLISSLNTALNSSSKRRE